MTFFVKLLTELDGYIDNRRKKPPVTIFAIQQRARRTLLSEDRELQVPLSWTWDLVTRGHHHLTWLRRPHGGDTTIIIVQAGSLVQLQFSLYFWDLKKKIKVCYFSSQNWSHELYFFGKYFSLTGYWFILGLIHIVYIFQQLWSH